MLTDKYISKINGQELGKKILGDDRIKWTLDGSKILMANPQSGDTPMLLMEVCWDAVREIETLVSKKARHIMLNVIPPGITVPVHQDTVIDSPVRWHLPLITNKDAFAWDEAIGMHHLPSGSWYLFNYNLRHTVGNFGLERRIHLIVDLV